MMKSVRGEVAIGLQNELRRTGRGGAQRRRVSPRWRPTEREFWRLLLGRTGHGRKPTGREWRWTQFGKALNAWERWERDKAGTWDTIRDRLAARERTWKEARRRPEARHRPIRSQRCADPESKAFSLAGFAARSRFTLSALSFAWRPFVANRPHVNGNAVTWTIPIQVTIRVDAPVPATPTTDVAGLPRCTDDPALAEALAELEAGRAAVLRRRR